LLFLAFAPLAAAQAICYDNGPLFNSEGTHVGGGDESVLVGDETMFGHNASAVVNNEVADDFVAAGVCDDLQGGVLYAYQAGATAPSITSVVVRVYQDAGGAPGAPAADPDCSGTFPAGTTFTDVYRVPTVNGDSQRRLQRVEFHFGDSSCDLSQGRHWIGVQFTGSASFSGPWQPPVPRPLGSTTCPPLDGYPAHEDLNDAGFAPVTNGLCNVDFPFELFYNVETCGLTLGFSSVTLSPMTVAPGGAVTISGGIRNESGSPQAAALSLDYEREGGPSGTLPLAEGTVPPGTVPFSVTRRVPGNTPGGTYDLLLRLTEPVDGETCSLWPLTLTVVPTASDPGNVGNGGVFEADAPAENPFASASAAGLTGTHALSGAAPNPSAGHAALTLSVAESQGVRVEVLDGLGRRVALLHDGPMAPGTAHRLAFDGADLPPGVYVVRATGETFSDVRILTLTR
jgi:hypothetical protein